MTFKWPLKWPYRSKCKVCCTFLYLKFIPLAITYNLSYKWGLYSEVDYFNICGMAAILDWLNDPLRSPLKLVYLEFLKTHGLRNKSWKNHNSTIIPLEITYNLLYKWGFHSKKVFFFFTFAVCRLSWIGCWIKVPRLWAEQPRET